MSMAQPDWSITNTNLDNGRRHYDTTNSSDLTRTVAALGSCLTTARATNRAPSNFDTSLEAACTPTSRTIPRVFLEAGFQAWFAYFLATEGGYARDVDKLAPASLEYIAVETAKIDAHESVKQLFSHLFQNSHRASSRRRYLELIRVELPTFYSEHTPQELNPRPPKRRRSEPSDRPNSFARPISNSLRILTNPDATITPFLSESQSGPVVNTEAMQPQYFPDVVPQSGNGQQDRSNGNAARIANSVGGTETNGSTAFDVDPRHQRAWPRAKNLPLVFPNYMCSTIIKSAGNAAIMVSFPSDPAQCQVVLDISPAEVQHVAKELFGMHISVKDGQRSIIHESGTSAKITGSLALGGAFSTGIDKLFGSLVGMAYACSPLRVEELWNGELLTQCLSMDVPGDPNIASRLELKVDAGNLKLIADQLWQNNPEDRREFRPSA